MLDIKRIRENLDDIKKAMERRGEREFDLDAVVELDNKRREILQEVEVMKNELNVNSKKIPQLIKEGKDVTEEKARLKELSDKIKGIDEKVKEVEAKMESDCAFAGAGAQALYYGNQGASGGTALCIQTGRTSARGKYPDAFRTIWEQFKVFTSGESGLYLSVQKE